MLIGDKGQSGGRRWEVSGFVITTFSDSPKVRRWEVVCLADSAIPTDPRASRWGGGRICPRGIFGQFSGQTLGGVQICPRAIFGQSQGPSLGVVQICYGNISGPLGSVAGWRFLPQGHFSPVPRSVAGIPSFCLKGILRVVPRSVAGEVYGFALGAFSYSPKVRRWVRHSPDSGFCRRPSLRVS